MKKRIERIGVFICKCGGNISKAVDADLLKAYVETLDRVVFAMYNTFTCSVDGQDQIKQHIVDEKLDGVIVGCCTPRQYEEMYRETAAEVGLNPYLVEIVNLREQCSYPHGHHPDQALAKAKALMRAAIVRMSYNYALTPEKIKISRETVVIGGGIAGMNASLKLAGLGYKVYLIERDPYLGGKMAKLGKTFPTDDCAMCTISPRLNDVYKHKNIEILAHSEIQSVERIKEGFKFTVLKKSRFVDAKKCNACGKCLEVCPVKIFNRYNEGLPSTKTAIGKDYPSAVPNVYTIERHGLPPCTGACPLGQHPQAYSALIRAGKFEEAARVILRDNPFPSVCGRVCHHPCEGQCTRGELDEALAVAGLKRYVFDKADASFPKTAELAGKKAAIVGSGPAGLAAAVNLAMRGCAVEVFEAQAKPGGVLYYGIPSYRLPKEILQRDLDRITAAGVAITTGCTIGRDKQLSDLTAAYDAVFVAAGLGQNKNLPLNKEKLAGVHNGYQALWEINAGEKKTGGEPVVIIGGGNAAVDVARVLKRCGQNQITLMCIESREKMPAIRDEVEAALKEGITIRNGVMPVAYTGAAHGGASVAAGTGGSVAATAAHGGASVAAGTGGSVAATAAGRVTGVTVKTVKKFEFVDGRLDLELDEGSAETIPAATVYETVGQAAEPGLLGEKYADLIVGGKLAIPGPGTYTGRDNLFVGGDMVTGPTSVSEVIGSGKCAAEEMAGFMLAGSVTAARGFTAAHGGASVAAGSGGSLAATAHFRTKVEPADALDRAKKIRTPTGRRQKMAAGTELSFAEIEKGYTDEEAQLEAARCLACGGCSYCRECERVCEPGAINFGMPDETVELTAGGIVLALGWQSFDGTKLPYGMGKYPNVIDQMQLARMLDPLGPTGGLVLRPDNGQPVKKIVMIQCAGSRGEIQKQGVCATHCSKICCMAAIKHAGLVKKYFDESVETTICYIDIRTSGKGYEEYYGRARAMGITFVRGIPANVEYNEASGQLRAFVTDQQTDTDLELESDLVVLSLGTLLSENSKLLTMLGTARDEYGFIREYHVKIKPTVTFVKNVMIAGSCVGPKDISDSIAQSDSAALNLASYIKDGYVYSNPVSSFVSPDLCRACGRCVDNCEFKALKINEEKHCAEVELALCEGCCKCAAVCPTGAAAIRLNEPVHLDAMIKALKDRAPEGEAPQ